MSLRILKAGPMTTIQDFGRSGYLSSGITSSGAMDTHSLALANLLVGNPMDAAGLEFCLFGPSVAFDSDSCVSVTGGFSPKLNGSPVKSYTTLNVSTGDVLEVGHAKSGVYGYLAVSGSFAIEAVLGSMSTNTKCGIGGVDGNRLSDGMDIALRQEEHRECKAIIPPAEETGPLYIRVILGPQTDRFTKRGLDAFLGEEYTVAMQSDRMGIRLEGAAIETINGTDIISDGTALGAIQVPGNGQPIILMADRQTTGGYAKLGVIASIDIPRLAQAKPGRKIRFVSISVEDAQKNYADYCNAMKRFASEF